MTRTIDPIAEAIADAEGVPEAFTQAFEVTALVCAGLAVAAAIGTVLVLREVQARPDEVKAAA